ncbi:Isoprenylcysteine carboxyl methyltransferase family-domain-containing protein, partial [Ochromonadaceae sp. CCMP2298]
MLNFNGCRSEQFVDNGLGKIGTTGFVIGLVGGTHLGVAASLVALYVSGLFWSSFLSALVSAAPVLLSYPAAAAVAAAALLLLPVWLYPSAALFFCSRLSPSPPLLPPNPLPPPPSYTHPHPLHPPQLTWSLYLSLLCAFHFLEFFATAANQPSALSYDSFIVNHSRMYTAAALASWVEFWVEFSIFGGSKMSFFVSGVGLLLLLGGQTVRTVAMWQCGENFAHIIMSERRQGHKLVKTGIYSVLRHPAYFGWFYWSLGTQLLLCNPLCTVAYAAAAWHFFSTRVP